MKLTAFTDYSLRVLIYLAAHPGRRATIAQAALAFGMKENHLTKVVHSLGKAGWLVNVRGKGGGMSLARPPQEIVVGQVVRHAEGVSACCLADPLGHCGIAPACRLRAVLREAVDAFGAVLDRYTLADLVREPGALAGLVHGGPHEPPPVSSPAPGALPVSAKGPRP